MSIVYLYIIANISTYVYYFSSHAFSIHARKKEAPAGFLKTLTGASRREHLSAAEDEAHHIGSDFLIDHVPDVKGFKAERLVEMDGLQALYKAVPVQDAHVGSQMLVPDAVVVMHVEGGDPASHRDHEA